jgi:hypothetical protein
MTTAMVWISEGPIESVNSALQNDFVEGLRFAGSRTGNTDTRWRRVGLLGIKGLAWNAETVLALYAGRCSRGSAVVSARTICAKPSFG